LEPDADADPQHLFYEPESDYREAKGRLALSKLNKGM
jgi:hypothetical protein